MAKRKLQFMLVRDGERSFAIIATLAGWLLDRIEAPTLEEAERLAYQRVKELEEILNGKEEQL
jgi:hypothetical protein